MRAGIAKPVTIEHLMGSFDDALRGCGQRLAHFESNNFCTSRCAPFGRLEDLHHAEGSDL
jgi:hypothetical protein